MFVPRFALLSLVGFPILLGEVTAEATVMTQVVWKLSGNKLDSVRVMILYGLMFLELCLFSCHFPIGSACEGTRTIFEEYMCTCSGWNVWVTMSGPSVLFFLSEWGSILLEQLGWKLLHMCTFVLQYAGCANLYVIVCVLGLMLNALFRVFLLAALLLCML